MNVPGPSYSTVRSRTKALTAKFTSDPVLPLLGWTKAVETVVRGDVALLPRWAAYAAVVTVLWVAGDYLYRQVEDATDAAADAVNDAADDGGEA